MIIDSDLMDRLRHGPVQLNGKTVAMNPCGDGVLVFDSAKIMGVIFDNSPRIDIDPKPWSKGLCPDGFVPRVRIRRLDFLAASDEVEINNRLIQLLGIKKEPVVFKTRPNWGLMLSDLINTQPWTT